MAQITIFDVTKFFVPIYCSYYVAWLAVRHFGPYHPVGQHPALFYNADGHRPIFYATVGFVGTYFFVFILWKCFVWFLYHLDNNRRRNSGLGTGPNPYKATPKQDSDIQ